MREKLDLLGVIVGSVALGSIDDLRKLPGVKAVEEEAEVRIAPPSSGVQ